MESDSQIPPKILLMCSPHLPRSLEIRKEEAYEFTDPNTDIETVNGGCSFKKPASKDYASSSPGFENRSLWMSMSSSPGLHDWHALRCVLLSQNTKKKHNKSPCVFPRWPKARIPLDAISSHLKLRITYYNVFSSPIAKHQSGFNSEESLAFKAT
ncbi:hypothetical protein PMIN02_010088 [Paraphaeosphaeria minitans]